MSCYISSKKFIFPFKGDIIFALTTNKDFNKGYAFCAAALGRVINDNLFEGIDARSYCAEIFQAPPKTGRSPYVLQIRIGRNFPYITGSHLLCVAR
jgi:hypothetical protein